MHSSRTGFFVLKKNDWKIKLISRLWALEKLRVKVETITRGFCQFLIYKDCDQNIPWSGVHNNLYFICNFYFLFKLNPWINEFCDWTVNSKLFK